MSFEALGRTYHGGAPAPLQPGDLVTSRDAPEGAPTWVGDVELATNHVPPLYRVNQMGNGSFFVNPWEIRPLTDAEAVGLAEMLTGEKWRPFGTSGCLALFPDGGVIALAALHGEWSVAAPLGNGRIGCIASGKAGTQEDGSAAASRALIAYTIRG